MGMYNETQCVPMTFIIVYPWSNMWLALCIVQIDSEVDKTNHVYHEWHWDKLKDNLTTTITVDYFDLFLGLILLLG